MYGIKAISHLIALALLVACLATTARADGGLRALASDDEASSAGVTSSVAHNVAELVRSYANKNDDDHDNRELSDGDKGERELFACGLSTCSHDSDCPDWCSHCTSGLFQRYCER